MKRKPKGRLELNWMGKDSALIPVEDGRYDYAWVDPDDVRVREVKPLEVLETVGDMDADGAQDNLVVIGDSGDALRSLATIPEWKAKYEGQVKLVYIDPPFNTEQTFEHYADQLEHSVWLTMMRDRIRDMRPLLAPDATVWVHLDDAEVHRMRMLLDEEFGAERFVSSIAWRKRTSVANDSAGFTSQHDTILVYSTSDSPMVNRVRRSLTKDDLRYRSIDGDPRPWGSFGNTSAPKNTSSSGLQVGACFGIQHPLTGEMIYPPFGGQWAFKFSRIKASLSEYADWKEVAPNVDARCRATGLSPEQVRLDVPDLILADPKAANDTARARVAAGMWPEFFVQDKTFGRKIFQAEDRTSPPSTWWPDTIVGHNREAKSEIKALFPGVSAFSTPKPERLLERIVHIATHPGDLVVDFFGGSGTTAAVAHKMGRRWITVELLESTAQKFTVPRLRKVTAGEDSGGITSKTERVAVDSLPEGMTPEDAQKFNTFLTKAAKGLEGLDPTTIKALKSATKTRDVTTTQWGGGGGFTVAKIGPSMYEVDDTDGVTYLSPKATNGSWSKAVAGQMGFTLTPRNKVFAGVKGRQRLAVIDGVVDTDVVDAVVDSLGEKERAVIVGKAVLPGARDLLETRSPGSRIKQAPDDLFPKGTVK